MASTTVPCPSCRTNLKLPSNVPAGRIPKCPKCGTPVSLSGTVGAPAPVTDTKPSTGPIEKKPPSAGSGSYPLGTVPASSGEYDFLAPPQGPGELGRLGPYRVIGVLGAGGMGMVFKAEDPTLRRAVALKVMLPQVADNPTAKARFFREARAQAAIEHDHVIAIFQVGEDRGVPYLAMPLLKGETLGAALKQTPSLALPEILRIGREMAEGLHAAHERGLVHRDIKPGNVWLEGARRRVKILDFGLARATTDSDLAPSVIDEPVTKAGAAVGTPAYMSPEQARGQPVYHATDLFSMGIVMYQLATGHLPFQGADVMAVLTALALSDPIPPNRHNPALPPTVSDLILRLMAKRPGDRPASGEVVAEEFRRLEEGLSRPPETLAHVPASRGADPWADIGISEGGVVVQVHGGSSTKLAGQSSKKLSGMTVAPPPRIVQGRSAEVGDLPATEPVPGRRRRGRSWPIVGLAILAVGALLAFAFAALQLALPKGTLAIDSDIPDAEFVVKQDGKGVRERVSAGELTLPSGVYTIEFYDRKPNHFLSASKVSVPAEGRETVRARLAVPRVASKKEPSAP